MTVVKICGITRPEDGAAAVRAGADWLGLNFWPRSKRFADLARAALIARTAREEAARRNLAVTLVGVFVNQAPTHIARLAVALALDRVQLHGDESRADCAAVDDALGAADRPNTKVVKAVSLGAPADVDRARAYGTDVILADTPSPGYGGSGRTFDWALAQALVAAGVRVMLAGGLHPDNVEAAVAAVMPYGVDVASGVESAPGIKDLAKMDQFVRRAKRQERQGDD